MANRKHQFSMGQRPVGKNSVGNITLLIDNRAGNIGHFHIVISTGKEAA